MKNFLRTVIILAGFVVGPGLVAFVFEIIHTSSLPDVDFSFWTNVLIYAASSLLTGAMGIFFSGRIVNRITDFTYETEQRISGASYRTVAFGTLGLLIGLVIAFLISWMFEKLNAPWFTVPFNIVIYTLCGYVSTTVAVRMSRKSKGRIIDMQDLGQAERADTVAGSPKLLDTSVIIDGRIFDILKTDIIEGTIVIPEFVLAELRHVADSSDDLRRAKGRRGLDILSKIQKELEIPVEITDKNPVHISEVDAKLLYLAQEMDGKVITNDFNLNKVAAVQGIPIININELSNAVKPVMLPGEEIRVTIVKEGKENNQGIGYLEDGTMIVVEEAKRRIGETLSATVTSVLQTSAGRMIFARLA